MGYVLKILLVSMLVIGVALSVAYCLGGDGDDEEVIETTGATTIQEETTTPPETTAEETVVKLPNTGGSS